MNATREEGRGKRRLDFSRPFRGKVFYLDLPHALATVEREITQRGGLVEKFFTKKVRYLVTSKHKPKPKDVAGSTTAGKKSASWSPLTLSPDVPEGQGRAGVLSRSPSDGAKMKSVPVAHCTRGAKMLAASSKQKGKKPMDMIQMARKWDVKLLTLEELKAELKKLKPHPLSSEHRSTTSAADKRDKHYKVPSVRELKVPFLKVEDQSRSFRPLLYETDQWPLPNSTCPPNASPYDVIRKNGKVSAQLSRATGARLTQDLMASLPGPAAGTARRKPGYCECCAMRYEDLKVHLCSKKHRDYASDDTNFATLDAFAVDSGLDFDTYISCVKEDIRKLQECPVNLITPPSSPAAPPTPPRSPAAALPTSPCTPTLLSGLAARFGVPSPDRCTISAGFPSPRRGALCLKPVVVLGTGSPSKRPPGVSSPGPGPISVSSPVPIALSGKGSPKTRSHGLSSPIALSGKGSPKTRSYGFSSPIAASGKWFPHHGFSSPVEVSGKGSPRKRNSAASSPTALITAFGTGSPRIRIPGIYSIVPSGTGSPQKQNFTVTPISEYGKGSPIKRTLTCTPTKRSDEAAIFHANKSPRTSLLPASKRLKMRSPIKALREVVPETPEKQDMPVRPARAGNCLRSLCNIHTLTHRADTIAMATSPIGRRRVPGGWDITRRGIGKDPGVMETSPVAGRRRGEGLGGAEGWVVTNTVVMETSPVGGRREVSGRWVITDTGATDKSPVGGRLSARRLINQDMLDEPTRSPLNSPLAGRRPHYLERLGAPPPTPPSPFKPSPFLVSLPLNARALTLQATPTAALPDVTPSNSHTESADTSSYSF